jgi:tRNA-2-methylthio-N6-dimethylallyladenosine synthase
MTNKFHSVKPILNSGLKQVFIETYGCQMNVNDSEVVLSLLQEDGYSLCNNITDASLILINTCSIRENAEKKIWSRLEHLKSLKNKGKKFQVGIIGCMAERLKEKLLEDGTVEIVVGPDAYRDLPRLLSSASLGDKKINTILSLEETYADISPVRMDKNGITAFISIMRGCDNYCSYCVVPYVRGRERSRNPKSILREAAELAQNGYKEITLLGQNVNSYKWDNGQEIVSFAKLLEMVAEENPGVRVRFSTSHPKDIERELIESIARHHNICKHIHLPIQSGSNAVLGRMNRKYTREEYFEKVNTIREIIPECTLSTDIIAGFSGETEEDHKHTLSAMREAGYYTAFMFQYSERPDTTAAKRYKDDVPPATKNRRLNEIITLQNELSYESNQKEVGKTFEVLIEGISKKSEKELFGRTSGNKVCVFPAGEHKPGEYVNIRVTGFSSATLKGELVQPQEEKE